MSRLIGYTSDERYVALPDVQVELEGPAGSVETRSRATGALYADVAPGTYRVTLQKPGYGAKRVEVRLGDEPVHFRLLADGLLGYAWPKWVRSGERSEFRVHSVEPYKLELWRYGWQKELVRKIGWFDEHGPLATMQITPDGDYTQTGVQWNKVGYGSKQHHQYVAAPERSGLYYFHARTDSGRFFAFPWIVAPAHPTAKIAVLAANITWNAYNNFGGRSNYIHADRMPRLPTVNARMELLRYNDPQFGTWNAEEYLPLSFDRPEPINHIPEPTAITEPIEGRAACHVAPTEWRMLGWMEREGFDYDLYAETQLHDGTLDLDAYRVLVLGPHPEYWSREMYQAVKRWVFERGGRLVYLGGNGLNCEVSFPDADTVVYHNGDNRKLQANLERYESRFGMRVESEAHLLGVVYSETGVMTAAPYRVLAADHWALAGTGLENGDTFGEQSLHERIPGGASGHETDKISASSPTGIEHLAKGLNPDDGGADLVHFATDSGGAVFSAGSICWSSSLLVDAAVSRITSNVLRRFVQ
ncbi:MAG: carboxypeptidase regulatory-like domain-containing protein [Planctomycetota bacterium]|nr:MAG: carboxypeptidase regulatory-like domain-containing protein [Planctomycetota bacterium]